jgi:hypothetical protein
MRNSALLSHCEEPCDEAISGDQLGDCFASLAMTNFLRRAEKV